MTTDPTARLATADRRDLRAAPLDARSARRTGSWAAASRPRTSCRRRGSGGRGVDHDTIDQPRAYLLTDHHHGSRSTGCARSPHVGRATSGPWLPEPVASDPDPSADGEAAAQLADDVSMAMLIVLELTQPVGARGFRPDRGLRNGRPRGRGSDRSHPGRRPAAGAPGEVTRRGAAAAAAGVRGTAPRDHRAVHGGGGRR